ncbi:MAG TPA: hypothetical protein VF707_07115 [Ardenticatenaceae bacterium]|jgi:hypothetical protein
MRLENAITETVEQASKLTANVVKDIWSALDAAVEKPSPIKALGQRGVQAMQGVRDVARQL